MLQTGLTYIRIASKWWTYVSAEIYYSKQFSIFFYSFASTRYSGKNDLFLEYFDNQIVPIFADFAEKCKIISDSTFNSTSSTQTFLISSETRNQKLVRLSYIHGK